MTDTPTPDDIATIRERRANRYGATNTSGYKQPYARAVADIDTLLEYIDTLEAAARAVCDASTDWQLGDRGGVYVLRDKLIDALREAVGDG